MNKPVQILLLFALLPMIGIAREETLEERKQRIARKYLRERMAITQSDMFVPSDLPKEDEDVTDSEKFKELDVGIAKHEGGVSLAPPPPRPRPVPRADSNWLLGNMDETEDPYADPSDPYSTLSVDSGDDLWSATWGDKNEDRSSVDSPRKRQSYDPRKDPYARQDSRTGILGGKDRQQGTRYGGSSAFGQTDSSGRQQNPSSYSSGLNLQSRRRTYGSDPSQGLLSTPYTQQAEGAEENDRKSSQGYQPYKSPYEKQREQQRKSKSPQQQQQPQQEFKRPDSYQQWKERNKTWDPTADDAYINEMMQQNKR